MSYSERPAQQRKRRQLTLFLVFIPGVNSVQYLSQVEMFSLEVRSLGVAVVSVVHFLAQFGSSRSVNPIVNSGGPWSLFLFFFIMSIASLVVSFASTNPVSPIDVHRADILYVTLLYSSSSS